MDRKRRNLKSGVKSLVPGMVALFSSVPVAFLIYFINESLPNQPEKAVGIVALLFAILLIIVPTIYLRFRGHEASPGRMGLVVLAMVGVLLVSIYLFQASFSILFPADFLIWSESDFVNDILKFRMGHPIYNSQVNNDSFVYTPGTQVFTYLLAWLVGGGSSVPVYRLIQVGYTLLAAIVATFCCRKLVELSDPSRDFRERNLWTAVLAPFFFLMATNSLTNPYVHFLHNDALSLLISVVGYWLLLNYIENRGKMILALMAIVPAVGFLVKQSLAIWALLYCVHLAVFDRPRSVTRSATFALGAFGGIGAAVGACYLFWGDHFIYWVFTVMGSHPVSPLRSVQHMLDGWAHFVIGLLGGWILLRGKSFNQLFGPWVVWLLLFLIETYTSGVAWMRNHMGPGSLLAGIWFFAALVRAWPYYLPGATSRRWPQLWLRGGIAVAMLGLLFNGLGVVRIPVRPFSGDAYRYVKEIERQFQGQMAQDVLLDVGSWIYLKDGVVPKDRAPSIGERGYTETGDFSGIVERIKNKRYAKILVRRLHSEDFWYDHFLWRKSSGIKKALLENYDEVGSIAEVETLDGKEPDRYTFSRISILVRKPN